MAFADRAPAKDRAAAGIAVAALHIMLGYALVAGLAVDLPRRLSQGLALFTPLPPHVAPPPPPPARRPAQAPRREGAAAPPALEAKATPVVAPPPVVITPVPPPVVAAPLPENGSAPRAGAAPIPGPGSGSGGEGNGFGSGGSGDGPGGGGGGREVRLIRGTKANDYPKGAGDTSGVVGVRFVVGVKGRLTACEVTRSSGSRVLDEGTCPLLVERLRYRPELDARGTPVPTVIEGTHRWSSRRGPDTYDQQDEPDDDDG